MCLEELQTVRNYLWDYLHTHVTTEEEFHCIRKMLRDVDRKERNILVETGVLIRITVEDIERIRLERRNGKF